MRQRITKTTNNDYRVDPNRFLDINIPEIAYILGLLWADGYIGKQNLISFGMLSKDLDTLIPIFNKTGDWRIYHYNKKNTDPQTHIQTNNDKIFDFLKDNGYVAKSWGSADKILSKIPENLKHYWFRGLVDGDGCFRLDRKHRTKEVFIASGYEQDWAYMMNLCDKLKISYKISRRKQTQNGKENKNSIFIIRKSHDLEIFGDYLYRDYENDKIGLLRKYEKYKEILLYIKEFQGKKQWKYIGVIRDLRTGKFFAKVKHNGKQKRFGGYDSVKEAAKRYDIEAVRILGNSIRTNQKLFGLL